MIDCVWSGDYRGFASDPVSTSNTTAAVQRAIDRKLWLERDALNVPQKIPLTGTYWSNKVNIGEIAKRTGLPAKTIRYYEDIELVKPGRTANGYRIYGESDLHRLAFIQRARSFDFSIEECRLLLSLYENDARSSSDVKAIALSKISQIDRKLTELKSLKKTLRALADNCHGDDKPSCPIIDDLAGRSGV